MRAALIREYFGSRKLGTIFGFLMGLSAMGTVIGPAFAGWVFDRWGSYHAAWLMFANLVFVAAIIIVITLPIVSNNRQGVNGKFS